MIQIIIRTHYQAQQAPPRGHEYSTPALKQILKSGISEPMNRQYFVIPNVTLHNEIPVYNSGNFPSIDYGKYPGVYNSGNFPTMVVCLVIYNAIIHWSSHVMI